MQKVLAIVGPTAVGKTSLSVELAKRWNGEIISGDSMQVYQRLDIGTAKITPEEMQGIPHHLINVRTVQERFTAADFKNTASQLIKEINGRNRLPIIVGGPILLQALLNDLQLGTANEDRNRWKKFGRALKSTGGRCTPATNLKKGRPDKLREY